jgi:hypothetical protein
MEKKLFLYVIFILIMFQKESWAQSSGGTRGVDFRMQFVSGKLDFTSISGIKRPFDGIGSELQTSLYLIERNRLRTSIFISSRVMTWTGKNVVDSEFDDIQTFSVAPGLELHYGPLYIQASSQRVNANAYYISSSSKGKQFTINAPCLAYGFNWKFGALGIGLGYSTTNATVSGSELNLNSSSKYIEKSYSFNLVYYIGGTPGKFFGGLFK